MKYKGFLYICVAAVFTASVLSACGTKTESSDNETSAATIQQETTTRAATDHSGNKNKGSNQSSKPLTQKKNPVPEAAASNPKENPEETPASDPAAGENLKDRAKTNIITADLEYDKLPAGWEELDSGAAEVTAYYGYSGNSNSDENPIAAIYVESFDGEKRYNTEDGVRERLQGWHQRDGLKDLTVTKSSKGIFEYSYSFVTESDGKKHIGYIFEDQGATWEISYFENDSLSSSLKEKLKSDFNKMINSCKIVAIEGDVA